MRTGTQLEIGACARRTWWPILAAGAAFALAANASLAQWTVIDLTPAGVASATVNGIDDGQQVGLNGMWRGTAASFVSLGGSTVWGVGSGQQAGRYIAPPPGRESACFWTGTAASRVNLHPAGALLSEARDAHGGRQVGFVGPSASTPPRAALWSGSAASVVYLSAVGEFAQAYGIHGDQQVGFKRLGTTTMAALWRGTADSFVSLQPAGRDYSTAFATDGAQQVGDVRVAFDGMGLPIYHAALWSGSAGSFVDLNPPGAAGSGARDVDQGEQVGYVGPVLGPQRAALWAGTTAWTDLHALLPAGFTSSAAIGISKRGQATYIVGNASLADQTSRVVMWVRGRVCIADVDDGTGTGTPDGGVTIDDLLYYLLLYADGNLNADVDDGTGTGTRDGGVTIDDLLFYLFRFDAGC